MLSVYKKIASAVRILRDAKVAADPQPRMQIFDALAETSNKYVDCYVDLDHILDRPSVTKCNSIGRWEKVKNEHRLQVKSTLFSDFSIRAYVPSEYNQALVFLPGSITGTDDVMSKVKNDFYLRGFCERESIDICVGLAFAG